MNKQEARDKFGEYVEDDDGNEVWQVDNKKVRGMLLKYSEEVHYLEGTAEWPDPEEWVDHFWTWCKGRIGVGYKGVLQCSEPSPSGRFDRIGKGELVRIATAYYENHYQFGENMDALWESVDKIEGLVESDEGYLESLEGMSDKEIIETFFNIYESRDGRVIGKRQSPNVRAYKYHIKQWVYETETIQSESETPSAEALVREWIDWMGDEILEVRRPIADMKPDETVSGSHIPDFDSIVGWCRELWSDSDKFQQCVVDKWNKPVGDDGGATPDAASMASLSDGVNVGGREKSGQLDISDY